MKFFPIYHVIWALIIIKPNIFTSKFVYAGPLFLAGKEAKKTKGSISSEANSKNTL